MKLRGVMAGLGNQSRGWFASCQAHPEVELVGFVEPDDVVRGQYAAERGIPAERCFAALADAIRACKPDFVLDVTPPKVHKSVALKAVKAGLHILGEKPISDNLKDARVMVEAGQQAGIRHMITQNFRFGPLPRATRRLLAEGAIGRPGQLDIAFYVPWADRPGTHYVTEPFMFLTDMCIHHFDMMRYVLAAEPVAVRAITWNQPWGWHKGDACHALLFEFEDGLKATHTAMGCSLGHQTPAEGNWRLDGPDGGLSWEDGRLFLSREHRIEKKRREEIPVDAKARQGKDAILDEFVAAVRANREPECSAADNLKSLRMALSAVKSAVAGGRRIAIG